MTLVIALAYFLWYLKDAVIQMAPYTRTTTHEEGHLSVQASLTSTDAVNLRE